MSTMNIYNFVIQLCWSGFFHLISLLILPSPSACVTGNLNPLRIQILRPISTVSQLSGLTNMRLWWAFVRRGREESGRFCLPLSWSGISGSCCLSSLAPALTGNLPPFQLPLGNPRPRAPVASPPPFVPPA